jgi:hypothetical protein
MENGFIDLAMYLSINKYFVRFPNASYWALAQSFKDAHYDPNLSSNNGNFVRTITEAF